MLQKTPVSMACLISLIGLVVVMTDDAMENLILTNIRLKNPVKIW
jgi:hypothetical protein